MYCTSVRSLRTTSEFTEERTSSYNSHALSLWSVFAAERLGGRRRDCVSVARAARGAGARRGARLAQPAPLGTRRLPHEARRVPRSARRPLGSALQQQLPDLCLTYLYVGCPINSRTDFA